MHNGEKVEYSERVLKYKAEFQDVFTADEYDDMEEHESTPLHTAVQNQDFELIKRLLQNGFDANEKDGYEKTPIAWSEGAEIIDILVAHGADVNAQDYDGDAPIHRAALMNNVAILKKLIDCGADINIEGYNKWTALGIACRERAYESIELLKENGGRLGDEFKEMPLLHQAVYTCDLKKVKELLNHSIDINEPGYWGRTALHFASTAEIASLLIENGAEIDALDDEGDTPLAKTLSCECKGVPIEMISQLVNLFVANGADVNFTDEENWTLLHMVNSPEIAEILIEAGAEISAVGENNWTPLHCQIGDCEAELVRIFIKHGADVNARDSNGKTPLHKIHLEHKTEIAIPMADMLIEAGADINALDNHGDTSLHCIAKYWNADLVRHLIEKGADKTIRNQNNETPLDIARKNNLPLDDAAKKEHNAMIELLS